MKRIALLILLVLAVCGCRNKPIRVEMKGDVLARTPPDNSASRLMRWTLPGSQDHGPAVAVIDVDGLLINKSLSGYGSLGENPVALFREKLEAVAADPDVQALVLRINSPGGGVTATDIMRRDLETFKQIRGTPVVACLMDVGAGGAYYVATAADTVVAHPTTVTGGIGVILNVYNLEDALGQYNVVPIPIKSGDKVDMATPVRTMEQDERDILEDIARDFHAQFKERVVRSRSRVDEDSTAFDGRIFTAREALEVGLVDELGYLDQAIQIARESSSCPPACRVVMYRRSNDRAYTHYDTTPNVPLQSSLLPLNVPGLDRSTLPTFLYLWQADPSVVTQVSG